MSLSKKDDILSKQRGVIKAINELKQLEKENAELKEQLGRYRDMKQSFENTKRLHEKYARDIDNPQEAWIYKTCCEVLRSLEGGEG